MCAMNLADVVHCRLVTSELISEDFGVRMPFNGEGLLIRLSTIGSMGDNR